MGTATFDLGDDVVIVTDGSSGIGRATALEFADAGATVVVADVRREPKDLDAADLGAMFGVNVRGVFLGTQVAPPT